MKHRVLLSGLLFLVLISCKSDYGKILEAKKQMMFAGIKGAPNHIKYSVKFEIYKPVSLDAVLVETPKKQTILKHFKVKDLKNGQILSGLDLISPGIYLLSAVIPTDSKNQKSEDHIFFKIKIPEKNQTYTLSTDLKQSEPIFMP